MAAIWQERHLLGKRLSQTLARIKANPSLCGLVVVLVAYVAFYALLLALGNGLPYVMDNNETFSSLWHARNALEHGIERSAGLADEVFSPHPEAHPYVHTHQGNFPRLFALAIYALGATSAESQILVTTFTVGLAAVMMGYLLFLRIGGVLFATACMLIMVTDYVVIAQWQVVTYRVWHMFFVFSSLLLVHAVTEIRTRNWALLLLLNFACLAYFELVFGAFVFGATALYALALHWRSPRRVVFFWLLQLAGFAVGLGVLIYQLTLYLGWDGVKQDFYLTFVARNHYKDTDDLLEILRAFYEGHRAIFWFNMQDGSQLRSIGHFVASITFYDLQPHTPLLTGFAALILACYLYRRYAVTHVRPREIVSAIPIWVIGNPAFLTAALLVVVHFAHKVIRFEFGTVQWISLAMLLTVLGGWLIGVIAAVNGWFRGRIALLFTNRSRAGELLGLLVLIAVLPTVVPHVSFERQVFESYSFLYVAFLLIYVTLLVELFWKLSAALNRRGYGADITYGSGRLYVASRLVLIGLLTGTAVFLATATDAAFGVPARWELQAGQVVVFVLAMIVAVAVVVVFYQNSPVAMRGVLSSLAIVVVTLVLLPQAYNEPYRDLWAELLDGAFPAWSVPLLTLLAIFVAIYAGMDHRSRHVFGDSKDSLRRLLAFWAAGLGAYAVVFVLSPGYVFTGYRFRLVPFTAFHTVVLYGVMFAILFRLAWRRPADATGPAGREPWRVSAWDKAARVGAGTLAVLMAGYWIAMQATYIRLFPPDHYAVFQRLNSEPYRGASFAANSYAAPIAAYTGEWAYMDARLNQAIAAIQDGKIVLETSDEYLWFADRDTNAAYDRPRYYLCLTAQSMPSVVSYLKRRPAEWSHAGCEASPLVKLARSGNPGGAAPHPRLVDIDLDGPGKVGFARWAILELNWP